MPPAPIRTGLNPSLVVSVEEESSHFKQEEGWTTNNQRKVGCVPRAERIGGDSLET
jgi:hypothetical protein